MAQPHFGKTTIKLGAKSVPTGASRRRVAMAERGTEGGHFSFCYNLFMYYVYILKLKDLTYYHGSAEDLK